MNSELEYPSENVPVSPNATLKVLPQWLEDLLPANNTPQKLSADIYKGAKRLKLTNPDESFSYHDNLESADEANRTSGFDLKVEESTYKLFGEDGLLFYPAGKGMLGFIAGYTDEDRRENLRLAYSASQEAKAAYLSNPNDFYNSWHYVDNHPAFWTNSNLSSSPWYWDTEGYCSKLRQSVYKDGKDLVVSLEGGGHVDKPSHDTIPLYSTHYGDWRLEVDSDSFENAIIEMAFRLHNSYNSDGTSKSEDDFPFDTPEWVEELRGRLAAMKDSGDSNS